MGLGRPSNPKMAQSFSRWQRGTISLITVWGRREKGQREERRELSTRGLQMPEFPGHEHSCKQKKKRKGRKKRYYKINNLNVWSIRIIILAQSIFHKALSGLKVIFDMDTEQSTWNAQLSQIFFFTKDFPVQISMCFFSSCLPGQPFGLKTVRELNIY